MDLKQKAKAYLDKVEFGNIECEQSHRIVASSNSTIESLENRNRSLYTRI
jgi:hypothetical protein